MEDVAQAGPLSRRAASGGVLARRACTGTLGRDRGVSLSAFTAVVMVALILMVGLVVDGGTRSAAQRRAEGVAAAAARAALDASSAERLAGGSGVQAALRAGQAVIDQSGFSGRVQVQDDQAVVTVTGSVATVFLSLAGITQLRVEASATAQLNPSNP